MLLAALLLMIGGVIFIMARMLLGPERMNDPRAAFVLKRLSPADLGMRFEPLKFRVRDEHTGGPLELAAWWIPCPDPSANGRCVILIHGYADAKVGAIAWAPVWHALGYHILALDLRAHGESGGDQCTAGYFERHDVNQVLDQVRAERPEETRTIVLFGISMGAAVATA